MNTNKTQMEWTEIRGLIKQKWSKLAEADIEGLKGNMSLISDKLQKLYGYTKDKAEQEYTDFKKTLEPAVAPAEAARPN